MTEISRDLRIVNEKGLHARASALRPADPTRSEQPGVSGGSAGGGPLRMVEGS